MDPTARIALAQRRIQSVLAAHTVATARTLEQKISDAGPFDQRIDPHVLSQARDDLGNLGIVSKIIRGHQTPWYHLAHAPQDSVNSRLLEQESVHDGMIDNQFVKRCGQALEIAVFKALRLQQIPFLGSFSDLTAHDDVTLYSKEEPPSSISGLYLPLGKKLDFLMIAPTGSIGIEVKNTRPWLYPHSSEIRELIFKCCCLNAVPLMIARRIAYVSFSVLNPCGFIFHETYNQRFPNADARLADMARNKKLLGYHDIRLGNEPDSRMNTFFQRNLPKIIHDARTKFDHMKDLLSAYGSGQITYPAFAAEVRRSSR